MRILAIDPGSQKTGFALLEKDSTRWSPISSGCLFFDLKSSSPHRLCQLRKDLLELIERYHPQELAIEKAFFAKNAQSALKLGQARGVILMTAAERGLEIFEYSATQVKSSVCGAGRASKAQVQEMVRILLKLPKTFEFSSEDEADALAIGLTHSQTRPRRRELSYDCTTEGATRSQNTDLLDH